METPKKKKTVKRRKKKKVDVAELIELTDKAHGQGKPEQKTKRGKR